LLFGAGLVFLLAARQAQTWAHRLALGAAFAQTLVTVIALPGDPSLDAFKVWIVNGFFIALWAGSALLFRRRRRPGPAARVALPARAAARAQKGCRRRRDRLLQQARHEYSPRQRFIF
jgi:hypothetical protein